MMDLFILPAIWNLPTAHSFSLKMVTFLKIVNLPFNVRYDGYEKAPNGMMPYINDDGHIIADTNKMITYLKEKYQLNIDNDLTDENWALTNDIQQLIEEQMYWIILYSRFIDPVGWDIIKHDFFQTIPEKSQDIIATKIKNKFKKELEEHGLLSHSEKEIYKLAAQYTSIASETLGKKNYMFGDDPHTIDACVFGFLGAIYFSPLDTALNQNIKKHPNLIDYCERIMKKYNIK